MSYQTIIVKESIGGITIIIDRIEKKNSINNVLLEEINQVLDFAEKDSECRLIILEGQNGIFCTGMDFGEAVENEFSPIRENQQSHPYMETIKRFSLIPKVVVSIVDGIARAGGIGLVAASDLVIATPKSEFSLTEALWGLLPAMVAPYLIRRTGFQIAYKMTFTTAPLSAQDACNANLVDEISENPKENIRKLWLRLTRLEESTIGNIKQYFRKMWYLTNREEELAVQEILKLTSDPTVKKNISNYINYRTFPWNN